jgi:class 3 adenylate cyclase/pimeloyl-ACP methyl ester carboxylesterase
MVQTQTVTILFCDLVASTERRARLGDDAFDEFTARFLAALRGAVAEHRGREVKTAGDGLMVVFPASVADAVACAVDMHRAVTALAGDAPAQLRVGISTGEVAIDGDDYAGMPVVEAARLEAQAAPGQTLANAIVRSLVGTRRALRFRDVGALMLKGLPAPLAAVEVVDTDIADDGAIAPVPTAPSPAGRRRRGPLVTTAALVVVAAIAIPVVATRSSSGSRRDQPRARGGTSTTAAPAIPAPRGYTPRLLPVRCPPDVLAAEAKTTCKTLVVPEDRRVRDGPDVRLLVTIAPPRSPGAHGVPTIDVCGCEDFGTSLARQHAELIHVAQRGMQQSDPLLACPELSAVLPASFARRADDQQSLGEEADALTACQSRWRARGVDPAHYNYLTAARDLLDLMTALHLSRANFVAFETASVEVFEVLREAPNAVRSITLDNPPPPGLSVLSDEVGDLKRAFDRYVGLCAAQQACRRSFPGLAERLRTIFATAQARPTLVRVTNPLGGAAPKLQVLMDGHREIDALQLALSDAASYPVIASAIAQPGLDNVAASIVVDGTTLDANAPWGAYLSYTCSYDFQTVDANRVAIEARTYPELVGSMSYAWPRWCTAWKVPDVSSPLSRDVVSDVPTLLFRGDVTPHGTSDWLSRIERGLTRAQGIVFPTLGSDLLSNGPPCLSKLRGEFLDDPTEDFTSEAAACATSSPPVHFATPSP